METRPTRPNSYLALAIISTILCCLPAGIVSIIDICSKRGAFEGSELETVGALRSRVAAFVEQARPPVEEAEAEADPDPEGREQPEDEA